MRQLKTSSFAKELIRYADSKEIEKILDDFINEFPIGSFEDEDDLYEEVICGPAPKIGDLLKMKVDAENDDYCDVESHIVDFFKRLHNFYS